MSNFPLVGFCWYNWSWHNRGSIELFRPGHGRIGKVYKSSVQFKNPALRIATTFQVCNALQVDAFAICSNLFKWFLSARAAYRASIIPIAFQLLTKKESLLALRDSRRTISLVVLHICIQYSVYPILYFFTFSPLRCPIKATKHLSGQGLLLICKQTADISKICKQTADFFLPDLLVFWLKHFSPHWGQWQ